jgi:GTP:adenosylcobinamide-phosphate guanylyltransferase
MQMNAIVTAGGIPLPEDPLYEYSNGDSKALLEIHGRPMIQWVLDALGESQCVKNVVIVGLSPLSGVTCSKPLYFLGNQGKMLDNIRVGTLEAQRLDPAFTHVMIVSSDIPAITGEMVDWVVETAMEDEHLLEVYYNVIPREVMEERFPGSKRTYTHLKGMDVCGGDLSIGCIQTILDEKAIWTKLITYRKSPLRQAALIGWGTFMRLALRRLTLEDAVEQVTRRLGVTGRALVCPYAEIGMDVDKPAQLEIMRRELRPRRRRKKAAA